MQHKIVSHQVTDPEIAQIHALLTLKEGIFACKHLIASAKNPVAGLQIIPQPEVDGATARLELLERKLAEALEGSTDIVKERYEGAVPYLPLAE